MKKMIKCNWCGAEFTEDKLWYENDGVNEPYYACPICKSDDLQDGIVCEVCGKFVADEDAECGERYCKDCYDDAINSMIRYMKDNVPMTAEHKRVFLDIWEWGI